jgi:agmatinase
MNAYTKQFLCPGNDFTQYNTAAALILPVPYEGGISYGNGTAMGPDAVLDASVHLELYDDMLEVEPHRMGIATVAPPEIFTDPIQMNESIFHRVKEAAREEKFMGVLGGDHSISPGCVKAMSDLFGHVSVIQLDAHADLREEFKGSRYSHACAMSRIRELTDSTLQIGIRSMSAAEADRISNERMRICTMTDFRDGGFDVAAAIEDLPGPVYITVDVDVFDWSVVRSTGTPEPGGMLWDEAMALLLRIFLQKNVIGFDVVELAYHSHDINSPFAVAKLIYKMLGFKLYSHIQRERLFWPNKPSGSIFY